MNKDKIQTEILMILFYLLICLLPIFYAALKQSYDGYWWVIPYLPLCLILYDWATIKINKWFALGRKHDG